MFRSTPTVKPFPLKEPPCPSGPKGVKLMARTGVIKVEDVKTNPSRKNKVKIYLTNWSLLIITINPKENK